MKGNSVNNVEINLSQYADGTTFILDRSRESLFSPLAMLDDLSKVSALRHGSSTDPSDTSLN